MSDSSRDEQLFDRLRQWLVEARSHAEAIDDRCGALGPSCESEAADGASAEDFGLYRLVEEFTSLRHELKLQTKSARGLEEQSATLQKDLRQALECWKSIEPKEAQAAWSAGRALAAALADVDEALDRGRIQIERAGDALIEEPNRALPPALDELFARQSWIRRWLCAGYQREVRLRVVEHGRQHRASLVGALLAGYQVIQSRLSRVLAAERIRRIETVGRPVDPEQMIVVEVVSAADHRPGVVVDEVRRGYLWNDRVLRCAEVRAAGERSVDTNGF